MFLYLHKCIYIIIYTHMKQMGWYSFIMVYKYMYIKKCRRWYSFHTSWAAAPPGHSRLCVPSSNPRGVGQTLGEPWRNYPHVRKYTRNGTHTHIYIYISTYNYLFTYMYKYNLQYTYVYTYVHMYTCWYMLLVVLHLTCRGAVVPPWLGPWNKLWLAEGYLLP